jgi:hypothetical protein
MAKPTKTASAKSREPTRRASATEQVSTTVTQGDDEERLRAAVCTLPQVPPRIFGPGFDPDRARAILVSDKKWVNGTQLRYHFLSQSQPAMDVKVVRDAFQQWKKLPIGLEFLEVADRNEAEIRITFDRLGWEPAAPAEARSERRCITRTFIVPDARESLKDCCIQCATTRL